MLLLQRSLEKKKTREERKKEKVKKNKQLTKTVNNDFAENAC
jgi:hypothetical protein